MFKIVSIKVEGSSIEDYTTLQHPEKVLDEGIESQIDATDYLEYEVKRMRKNGAEVVFTSPDRAFVINESNEPTEVLDVLEY